MNIDHAINAATFDLVVAKRHRLVAANKAVDAAEDACTCTTRRCAPECGTHAAWSARDEAGRQLIAAEAVWRDWHAACAA
jgi:hypothetical protein